MIPDQLIKLKLQGTYSWLCTHALAFIEFLEHTSDIVQISMSGKGQCNSSHLDTPRQGHELMLDV